MKSLFTPLLIFLGCYLPQQAFAQGAVQTVKGTIIDQESEMPLIGATVELIATDLVRGATTDIDGRFRIEGIPVGRQNFRVSYLGYASITVPNVLVTSGKEVSLEISLQESVVEMDEVVVTASAEKDKATNEMATISARSFSVEEVTRYSGGRNDVSRLATNFAGVSTADDSRNDIVIRGNSPTGVLWRLEGVPIPNPNHFSTLGTTGGPVSALNTNLLSNSDFLTSAFPAEYGNALAGVFDIGFRSGNKDNYEFTGQLGAFSGLEAMVEGPLTRKKNSSMLVAYRHSFVSVADNLGIPIGTNAIPNYRDLSFKFDFANGKAGKFSIFGIGATSDIDFIGTELDDDDLFGDPNQDAFAESRFGVLGVRHNLLLDDKSYLRTVVSVNTTQNDYSEDSYQNEERTESLNTLQVSDVSNTLAVSSFYNRKFNARLTLRTGILIQYTNLDTRVIDRERQPDRDGDGIPDWAVQRDFDDYFGNYQAYAQAKYRITEKWTLNTGLNLQYFDFNESAALEPRVAVNWRAVKNGTFNFGYGLHHQTQPLPVFLFQEEISPGVFAPTNEDLDFTRSHHLVLGYDHKLGNSWRLKSEVYYQFIDQVPVEEEPTSFSVLNSGADFTFPEVGSLVNEGIGRNYGVELTLEKFFSQGYYGLLTTSIFDSKYEGSDGVERNTAFNNGYVVNVLGGKEFKIGKDKRNAITLDMKMTTAGGRYYTPVDLEASRKIDEEVLQDELAFTERFDPYFRLDIKVGYQLNSKTKKFSQQFFLDFQNITNRDNVFTRRYNELTNEVNTVNQAGFFPDILYRIQF